MLQDHWENVYRTKGPEQISWFRPHLEKSLAWIEHASGGNLAASIVDVGGGASTLVDDLLGRGYQNLTILDISERALEVAQERLGTAAKAVTWLHANVLEAALPAESFDLWHDRAVFHFLTSAVDRSQYVSNVLRAVRPGGHVIVATFGPDGPMKCSGLDVMRYDGASLAAEFGGSFQLLESRLEMHETPFGTTQQFVYAHMRRTG